MNKLKIGLRLALAFGAVLPITATIATISASRLGALKNTAQSIDGAKLERGLLAQSWPAFVSLNGVRSAAWLKAADGGIAEALIKGKAQTSKPVRQRDCGGDLQPQRAIAQAGAGGLRLSAGSGHGKSQRLQA